MKDPARAANLFARIVAQHKPLQDHPIRRATIAQRRRNTTLALQADRLAYRLGHLYTLDNDYAVYLWRAALARTVRRNLRPRA